MLDISDLIAYLIVLVLPILFLLLFFKLKRWWLVWANLLYLIYRAAYFVLVSFYDNKSGCVESQSWSCSNGFDYFLIGLVLFNVALLIINVLALIVFGIKHSGWKIKVTANKGPSKKII